MGKLKPMGKIKVNIKQVEVFETTDGELFKDEQEAKDHQAELDLHIFLDDFVERYLFDRMDKTDVVNALFDHFDEIVDFVENNDV